MTGISFHVILPFVNASLEASEGLVKFVGIAPEESENSLEFIRQMKDKVDISLAHTNADYDTALAAFNAGANHAVHLYNGMPEIPSPGSRSCRCRI